MAADSGRAKNARMVHPAPRPRQQGFTLIEVLVALVIFTFGLLATAGLVLSSLQANKFTSNSVMATTMAREYSELMQMLPDGATSTESATAGSTATLMMDTNSMSAGSPGACTGAGKTCTPSDLVGALRSDWGGRVKSASYLPGGRAEVCRDSTPRNGTELEWDGCDWTGSTVLVKMGWLGKLPVGSGGTVDMSWQTDDKPRFAVSVMGNLRDYVSH